MEGVSIFTRVASLFTSPAAPAHTTEIPSAGWLVVGLGNPGPRYAATRHNVGYMCVDSLLDAHRTEPLTPLPGFSSLVARMGDAVAVRPTTFMNNSGKGVAPLASAMGVDPGHIIVIHDELDLPEGTVRVKMGGNENGHNGLKSLTEELGTRDYLRVRIGIARPPTGMSVPDYVLTPAEGGSIGIDTAARAVDLIISAGLATAQNEIHRK
ncbi:aminoacyl-tRNA hydrolase [Corynebacterium pacaense]|uniref:aminoacyl-tRNA hydrolase n=1 Tax=Corynebacterium pacaense TaxID=1816684 RepID=UPI0009BA9E0A|nr:aminoacyl-tRNA hydrolase [Corynebacterium pacaense]